MFNDDCPLVIGVTGFTGRLGSGLVDFFGLKGINVKLINLRFAEPKSLDIQTKHVIEIREQLMGVDVLVHLAGEASVGLYSSQLASAAILNSNTLLTIRVLEAALMAGVKHFIYLSSAKVYGNASPYSKPFTETMVPFPADVYSMSKLLSEESISAICHKSRMYYTIIRAPVVLPKSISMSDQRLAFFRKFKIPVPIGASHNIRRSYIIDLDLFKFIYIIAGNPLAKNEVFNVAGPESASGRDLVKYLINRSPQRVRFFSVNYRLIQVILFILRLRGVRASLGASLEVDTWKAARIGFVSDYSIRDLL